MIIRFGALMREECVFHFSSVSEAIYSNSQVSFIYSECQI